ncbi:MAG: tetratricopeptide repeat protein [Rhodopirellula sp. JB044]|uniref:tetratricopeptide repeat protein n=1 Tax=Rhodopirellula sp. JB044 TaxID=3342844 RepID=UPI00370BA994
MIVAGCAEYFRQTRIKENVDRYPLGFASVVNFRSLSLSCVLVTLAAVIGSHDTWGQDAVDASPSVFELPTRHLAYQKLLVQSENAIRAGDLKGCEGFCERAIATLPQDPMAYIQLARVNVRRGDSSNAIENLRSAGDAGYREAALLISHQDFATLKPMPEFQSVVRKIASNQPKQFPYQDDVKDGVVEDGIATVSKENTGYVSSIQTLIAKFALPEEGRENDPSRTAVVRGQGKAGELVRQWFLEGTASGNRGDFYDNHDHDHSNMDYASFPQLTRIEYVDEAKDAGLTNGLQTQWLFARRTIGNSSTALTGGPFWRSQPRAAYTQAGLATRLYLQYVNNHLYFYPEHRDHDPGLNGVGGGYGDLYPANTPYLITSQGSSGSDRPFMHAIALTLAALRPDVKDELTRKHALMPTIQMLFRSCSQRVADENDYLTAKAHPSVFDSKNLNVERMVRRAHALTIETLPPLVRVRVLHEDEPVVGVNQFDSLSEKLFDTPCSIARVARSLEYQRRMILSAEGSEDLNGHELTWHWVVLRGDAEKIQITPLGESGSKVELIVAHHEPFAIPGSPGMVTNRVEIGVFVHNGNHYSAPAFVSTYFPTSESRLYDEHKKIQSVRYRDYRKEKHYADPLIEPVKDWQDLFRYDDEQRLLGWTRLRNEERESFCANGGLITERDDFGRPTIAKVVNYVVRNEKSGYPVVVPVATDKKMRYTYASDSDRIGTHVVEQ